MSRSRIRTGRSFLALFPFMRCVKEGRSPPLPPAPLRASLVRSRPRTPPSASPSTSSWVALLVSVVDQPSARALARATLPAVSSAACLARASLKPRRSPSSPRTVNALSGDSPRRRCSSADKRRGPKRCLVRRSATTVTKYYDYTNLTSARFLPRSSHHELWLWTTFNTFRFVVFPDIPSSLTSPFSMPPYTPSHFTTPSILFTVLSQRSSLRLVRGQFTLLFLPSFPHNLFFQSYHQLLRLRM